MKIYVSLLKSQIFDNFATTTQKIAPSSTDKKQISTSTKSSNSQNSRSQSKDVERKQSRDKANLSSISRNLSKTFSDTQMDKRMSSFSALSNNISKINPIFPNKNKLFANYSNNKNYFYASNLNKNKQANSFMNLATNEKDEMKKKFNSKLLNLEIEDHETTFKYFRQKKIPKVSYKVLESPNLKDDFYLHLLDWSKLDGIAVGLDKSIYVWEGKTANVNLMYQMEDDSISAVKWLKDGNRLLVGTDKGMIHLWDTRNSIKLREFEASTKRIDVITTMNMSDEIFTIGNLDKSIITYDLRESGSNFTNGIYNFHGHSQEVCGLKWSPDDRYLASGGNDNKLIIWNKNMAKLEKKFNQHCSAVKAIDWCPYKYGYLMSGGGTQDRTLKLWNISTMSLLNSLDTGSQVCNVCYSKISHEFVSTQGYSDNYILVWDSDRISVKATLKGHKDRVIYMALSPDSKNIVTAAGDNTIRFWKVFQSENDDLEELKLFSLGPDSDIR